MKAASVPALASDGDLVQRREPGQDAATTTAVTSVMRTGVPRARVHLGQAARQEAVARHDEEDPALAIEEGQDHRRQGDHRRRRR